MFANLRSNVISFLYSEGLLAGMEEMALSGEEDVMPGAQLLRK